MATRFTCCPKLELRRLIVQRDFLGFTHFDKYPSGSWDTPGLYRTQSRTESYSAGGYTGSRTVTYHVADTICYPEDGLLELIADDEVITGDYTDAKTAYDAMGGDLLDLGRTDGEDYHTESYGKDTNSDLVPEGTYDIEWARSNQWDYDDIREELALFCNAYPWRDLDLTPQEDDGVTEEPQVTTCQFILLDCASEDPVVITDWFDSYEVVAGHTPLTQQVMSAPVGWDAEMRELAWGLVLNSAAVIRSHLRFAQFGMLVDSEPCIGTRVCFTEQYGEWPAYTYGDQECESGWGPLTLAQAIDLRPCLPPPTGFQAVRRWVWLSKWHESPNGGWPDGLPEAPSICENSIDCPHDPDAPACDDDTPLP